MTNNSIFRRIRFIYNFSDHDMMDIFKLVGCVVNRTQIIRWLNKEDHEDYLVMKDEELATFLNGFIVLKRGKKEGPQPQPEKQLTNNMIFRKMRIALNLIDEDIIQILASVEMRMSKHELSALFRNPNQRQYVECNNQVLRNFFQGLEVKENRPRN
ncbi:MAG: hypothetical protein RLY35_336 [Bacteroidota bacterium]|jgi:uncharacterized protein YehS (DUF1456 family)